MVVFLADNATPQFSRSYPDEMPLWDKALDNCPHDPWRGRYRRRQGCPRPVQRPAGRGLRTSIQVARRGRPPSPASSNGLRRRPDEGCPPPPPTLISNVGVQPRRSRERNRLPPPFCRLTRSLPDRRARLTGTSPPKRLHRQPSEETERPIRAGQECLSACERQPRHPSCPSRRRRDRAGPPPDRQQPRPGAGQARCDLPREPRP